MASNDWSYGPPTSAIVLFFAVITAGLVLAVRSPRTETTTTPRVTHVVYTPMAIYDAIRVEHGSYGHSWIYLKDGRVVDLYGTYTIEEIR